jgi:DNA-directed RNA polymerase I, II, and III subunit RPABC3
MADAQLYEESFQVTQVNKDVYDRVHRLDATSLDNTTKLILDINSELYPIETNENIQVLVASTLNLDGSKDEIASGWRGNKANETSLADMWDYVCYGKVYKVEDPETGERM